MSKNAKLRLREYQSELVRAFAKDHLHSLSPKKALKEATEWLFDERIIRREVAKEYLDKLKDKA